MSSPQARTKMLPKYGWEVSLVAVIGSVLATLTLVTHLSRPPALSDQTMAEETATRKSKPWQPSPPGTPALSRRSPPKSTTPQRVPGTDRSARRSSQSADPHEVVFGAPTIGGRFILLGSERKRTTATSDELILRARVVSLAAADLVTPFQSAMLEVRSPGLEPINPERPFSYPVPAGNSRDEEIVFIIPSSLSLDRATLRIQYYNYQKEIPLSPTPGSDPH
jgi:hypothetical protein